MDVIAVSSSGTWPLLVVALIAAAAAVYGPIMLSRMNAKQAEERELAAEKKREEKEEKDRQRTRDDRLEDIKRSEEVARQVKLAADRAEEARIQLVSDNAETAKEALRQQEEVRKEALRQQSEVREAAEEAARLLAESNERIAEIQATSNDLTQAKLAEIKILVDGSYTAAMRGELNALKAHRATLLELIADRKGTGREPGKETVKTLEALEKEISDREAEMAERLENIAKAEAAGQTGLS